MSKKRRTRRDKQIADVRRIQITPSNDSVIPTYTLTPSDISPKIRSTDPVSSVSLHHYDYVMSDARKTLVIVVVLVAFNAVMYELLQQGIIHLRFLGL